jgi:hypothetical protein
VLVENEGERPEFDFRSSKRDTRLPIMPVKVDADKFARTSAVVYPALAPTS